MDVFLNSFYVTLGQVSALSLITVVGVPMYNYYAKSRFMNFSFFGEKSGHYIEESVEIVEVSSIEESVEVKSVEVESKVKESDEVNEIKFSKKVKELFDNLLN